MVQITSVLLAIIIMVILLVVVLILLSGTVPEFNNTMKVIVEAVFPNTTSQSGTNTI